MKKLIMFLFFSLVFVGVLNADEPDTQFKVTISVTFNAVSAEDAQEIISQANENYRDACTIEIKKTVVGDYEDITSDRGGDTWLQYYDNDCITLTPGISTTLENKTDESWFDSGETN